MHSKKILDKAVNFLKLVYLKLVKIHDTPHNIAVGFGLGVFAGIMPFAGPVVAVFLAMLFKANRLSAFLGGFITNTWITFLAFFFSIKVGSIIFRIDGEIVRARWMELLKDFHIAKLFKISALEIALPVLTGYITIALLSACLAYVAAIIVMRIRKGKKIR